MHRVQVRPYAISNMVPYMLLHESCNRANASECDFLDELEFHWLEDSQHQNISSGEYKLLKLVFGFFVTCLLFARAIIFMWWSWMWLKTPSKCMKAMRGN